MEKQVNYYSFAENDYLFLKVNIAEKRVSNAMASLAQNICERYLKHIIEQYCTAIDCTDVLKTHSLKKILRFLEEQLPDFKIKKRIVVLADGYYFSARYPGDESFFANQEDIDICWEAVQETKKSVDVYLESHRRNFTPITEHI